MLNKITNDEKYNFRKLTIKFYFNNCLFNHILFIVGDQLISFVAGEEFQESIMPMVILLLDIQHTL